MKTTIINLIGASGSNKKTIAKKLDELGFNVIQSYTTRPPLYRDEWGHEFIKNKMQLGGNGCKLVEIHCLDRNKIYTRDGMIACFNEHNSKNHYFITDEQVVRGQINVCVVSPKGAEQIHNFYKETSIEVVTIFVQADCKLRRSRLQKRVHDKIFNSMALKYGGVDMGNGDVDINHLKDNYNILAQMFEETDEHMINSGYKQINSRLSQDIKMFEVVKCDYMVSDNGNSQSVLGNIEKILTNSKE